MLTTEALKTASYHTKHIRLMYLILLLSTAFNPSCGKRKPPLPPISQNVELNGFQIGNKIRLDWKMPARNASNKNILNIKRVNIYRLTEANTSPLSLTKEEFIARSTLISSIPIKDSDFGLKTKSYTDELKFAGQQARVLYAIRFVNASGQKAAFSNVFLIEPTANIAEPPSELITNLTQNAINLTWKAPLKNVNETTPPNLLGYNLYSKTLDSAPPQLINKDAPIKDASYSYTFFEFGKKYSFFIRSVSLGENGDSVESDLSNVVSIVPVDTFKPASPDSITIAAAPNTISIFFAANTEKDIEGYKVYRSTNPNLPKEKWKLLTPEPIENNTFQDKNISASKLYYYYIIALDLSLIHI